MEKLAIIGTGIAGMASAHFLQKKFDVTLYEQNNYVGGHTNTIVLDEEDNKVYIDTGFMVFNHVTYPNLIRLFKALGVEEKLTSMSFSVQHKATGLEFCGSGLSGLFAQRKNIFKWNYIRFLKQINRFNSECVEVLTNPKFEHSTLKEYCVERGFTTEFLEKYLIPMSSAVWSTPPDRMLEFPARALVQFFHNHGFLGLSSQRQWFTLVHGSQQYREKLIHPFKQRILIRSGVKKIIRENGGVIVESMDGRRKTFDKVIVAAHADQALTMLTAPTADETRLLSRFRYQKNKTTLHTDESVMPKTKRAWSSWNYVLENDGSNPYTVYWMNSLQQVSKTTNYFVNVNGEERINPKKIVYQIEYEHPLLDVEAVKAQEELSRLNDSGPVYFCGSYFKYGFHEDALTSSVDLCKKLAGGDIW